MEKYVLVEWPDIQEYMNYEGYPEECYFDSERNVWFIPEDWDDTETWDEDGPSISDLEDALG